MNKWKITYNDYGTIRAVVIEMLNLYNIMGDLNCNGIYPDENNILKLEKMNEATAENTTDLTEH